MKAYIEDESWLMDEKGNVLASVEADDYFYTTVMEPKKWYIEYPEEELVSETTTKVTVNIYGLTNEQVIDLLTALNEAGFEAVLTTYAPGGFNPVPKPIWPVTPGITPNPPFPYVTYNVNTSSGGGSQIKYGADIPGQMGIHDYLDDDGHADL